MWETTNRTPFAVHGYPVRDARGCEHWGLAVRGTFTLPPVNGAPVRLAEVQPPVSLVPEFHDDGEELLADPDFTPFRPACDVTLIGTAHPPEGAAVRRFPVSLTAGTATKTIDCYGPRRWRQGWFGGTLELDGMAEAVPLSWRQTTGGADLTPDARRDVHADGAPAPRLHNLNPIGAGWVSNPRRIPSGKAVKLPPLAATGLDPGTPPKNHRPVGFGAVPGHWPGRAPLAGTFDARWEADRHPLLPTDFDPRFWQAAPPDQVVDLRGGEPIEVTGVHPEGPIAFRLPQILLDARTRIGAERIDSRMQLIAVTINTNMNSLTLTWAAAIPCPGRDTAVAGSTIRLRQAAAVVLS